MTMIEALEKVLREAPEGMQVYVTVCKWYGKEIAPWTEEIETVIWYAKEREWICDVQKTRDDNRWKTGQPIPNPEFPGYEQQIYRLPDEQEVIYVYVDPMSPEEAAEKEAMAQRKEAVAKALSKQPAKGKSPQWWRWKK